VIMKKIGRRLDGLNVLRDVVEKLGEEFEPGDVWVKCVEVYDVDRCINAVGALSDVVDVLDVKEEKYAPAEKYDIDFYKWLSGVLNLMGAKVSDYEAYYMVGVGHGIDVMVADAIYDVMERGVVDPVKALNECVKLVNPRECISVFVNTMFNRRKREKVKDVEVVEVEGHVE